MQRSTINTDPNISDFSPLPFLVTDIPRKFREPVLDLWAWHHSLRTPIIDGIDPADLCSYFEREAEKVALREPVKVVPTSVQKRAYLTAERYHLPVELLAEQVRAASVFTGSVRFQDSNELNNFISQWAVPHARLLAELADVAHSWQIRYVDEFARAVFTTGRLVTLPQDLSLNRVFIPEDDLGKAGLSPERLKTGIVDEAVRRLMWKQVIRGRDAFAQAMPLINEISPRIGRVVKLWWTGGLEVLNEIEKRDFDVWSSPIQLSTFRMLLVRIQARFGRTTIRKG